MEIDQAAVERTLAYIRESWDSTIRRSGHEDHPRLYVPHEYTSPSPTGPYQQLFYWDTYFTNLGLLADGRAELARHNAENICYLVRRLGFMPNSNTVSTTNRSQPPYLTQMVGDIYAVTGDRDWLGSTLDAVEKEHSFWSGNRGTPLGLNRYFHDASDQYLLNFYNTVLIPRLELERTDRETMLDVASHHLAEAESGHDFTPRFDNRCSHFAPVDLNSILYGSERLIARFRRELGLPGSESWDGVAEVRLSLMRRYLWDQSQGVFADYDLHRDRHSEIATAAWVWPLAVGVATRSESARIARQLARLKGQHGTAACQTSGDDRYQWGYPNMWAPIQYVLVAGLSRYGYNDEASHQALQFIGTVAREFDRSGRLWEKYDVTTGRPSGTEYQAAEMIGWTAGVFVALVSRLGVVA